MVEICKINSKTDFHLAKNAIAGTKEALIAQISVLFMVVLFFFDSAPSALMIPWFVFHLFNYSLRFYVGKVFMSIENNSSNYEKAGKYLGLYTLGLFLTSLNWGFGVYMLKYIPVSYYVVFYIIIIGYTYASILSVGIYMCMYLAFAFPMNLALGVHLILLGTKESYAVFVFMLLTFSYSFKSSKSFYNIQKSLIEERDKIDKQFRLITQQSYNLRQ